MAKRIITVDDSVSIRQMIITTLERAGYDVISAEDGQDGIKKLADTTVDLVITDLNMPRMNGIELITQIRQDSKHRFTPIIMLTTESGMDKKEAGRAAGATGWIVKPFDEDTLLKVINKVLG